MDTNTRYIARTLRGLGVDLYRTITIGDNVERIADAIRNSMSRAEIVITTGGLESHRGRPHARGGRPSRRRGDRIPRRPVATGGRGHFTLWSQAV
ncbi:MAG: molybdopterin-binding protein [Candidatus Moduliflexus flocculans]|nr:molybdopterin-binding protein [Candidatus Moduliflexus flocculans]